VPCGVWVLTPDRKRRCDIKTISAESLGKGAKVIGGPVLTDKQLLAKIKRMEREVASFGGAMYLAALKADAYSRGYKEV